MDDLLNKTRYNNLIRPATSASQLISIHLELLVSQLISVVGACTTVAWGLGEGAGLVSGCPRSLGESNGWPSGYRTGN